ncbi:hypothetical protein KIW84_032795 [Lathyrus oleraceus]|uniref:Uncharacterized protein n=1 Tax=Pisum sativum TaxID=3888 RepID=A0A9D4XVV8_PEA|nr:hypothetical protein KIW84_032795 [Pisum sativum]
MTPIETDEDVKSMFQCHITLSQLPIIEIYVHLVENLEEQPSHNENLEEQPTHNENLCYPTQFVQTYEYGMSQAIDEEPTQNNEPFIPNEEVGENNEDDLEEVRFEDLFGVSDDDGNEDIFDTPTVSLRAQTISLYNPLMHMQNISLNDAEPISIFGSFIPTHNADEIEEGIEYENKEERVLAVSLRKGNSRWRVGKSGGPHTCTTTSMSQDHTKLSSEMISKSIMELVNRDASLKVKVIIAHVAEKYRVRVMVRWLSLLVKVDVGQGLVEVQVWFGLGFLVHVQVGFVVLVLVALLLTLVQFQIELGFQTEQG